MKDERGLYYFPNAADRRARMYVRRGEDGGVQFRLWQSDHPEVWVCRSSRTRRASTARSATPMPTPSSSMMRPWPAPCWRRPVCERALVAGTQGLFSA